MKETKKKVRVGIEAQEFFDFLARIEEAEADHREVRVDYWSKEPPFRAIVEYVEYVREPETLSDELELDGRIYRCGDCPHLDFSNYWKSKKNYPCKYAKYGFTNIESQACELFCREIVQGEVEPGGLYEYERENHIRD